MSERMVGAVLILVMSILTAVAVKTEEVPPTNKNTQQSANMVAQETRSWVKDKKYYTSPWYQGAHRRHINYGCTKAPYYPYDRRCTYPNGFHHGVDMDMKCGTKLYAAWGGWVVHPNTRGQLGSAYGANAFRIRNWTKRVDVVIGHTRKVFVKPGQRVKKGMLIALSSDAGAPDGCHLHFETRPIKGHYYQALRPAPYLMAKPVRTQ